MAYREDEPVRLPVKRSDKGMSSSEDVIRAVKRSIEAKEASAKAMGGLDVKHYDDIDANTTHSNPCR